MDDGNAHVNRSVGDDRSYGRIFAFFYPNKFGGFALRTVLMAAMRTMCTMMASSTAAAVWVGIPTGF